MFRYLKLLYVQVVIAMCLGVGLGYAYPEMGEACKPLSDGFIKLVKMILAPTVFCVVTLGIISMQDIKRVGKLGIKTLLYFEAVTTFALLLGLTVAHLFTPGEALLIQQERMPLPPSSPPSPNTGGAEFFLRLIPDTFIGAFHSGSLLQILLLSLLTGISLITLQPYIKPLEYFLDALSHCLFGIIHIIMKIAPLGAFGAMAFTVGKFGISTLASLGFFVLCFYGTCLFFILVVLGSIMRLAGLRITRLLMYLKEELLIVFSTSSSESALQRLIVKLEQLGCKPAIARFVVPTGYSFNLDGSSIYFTMAALFIAQATDTSLSLTDQLSLLCILLITSKGTAGVAGSTFVTLTATLAATGLIPIEGTALLLGVDRFMEGRALTNFIGNAVGTVVISKWEKALDPQAASILSH